MLKFRFASMHSRPSKGLAAQDSQLELEAPIEPPDETHLEPEVIMEKKAKSNDISMQSAFAKFKAKKGLGWAMLRAYIGFRLPLRKKREYLIPKDKAAWLEYLLMTVKKKTTIEYLSDKELRKVIIRARPNLAEKKHVYQPDPDSPSCIAWSVEETADWIEEVGFPYLKEAFILNHISGRRLASVDCSALNQIGMNDLTEMRKVTAKIRELLDTPAPNMLRALMRIPPFEMFLRKKMNTGKSYDALSFQKFCAQEGFDYTLWANNKNALVACTCEVQMAPLGALEEIDEDLDEEDVEDASLLQAPTVEFVVRNLPVRDKTVQGIIEDVFEVAYRTGKKSGKRSILKKMKHRLDEAYGELGLTAAERLEFSMKVAEGLLEELQHTTEVIMDLDLLRKYIKAEVTPEKVEFLKETTRQFMAQVLPLSALLALGQFDLETIFKQEPQFSEFVDSIIMEAEHSTNSLVPEALAFVQSIINLAEQMVEELAPMPEVKVMVEKTLHDVRSSFLETHQQGRKTLTDESSMANFADPDEFLEESLALARISAEQIVAETLELAVSLTNVSTPEAHEEVKGEMIKVTRGSLNAAAAINKKRLEAEQHQQQKQFDKNERIAQHVQPILHHHHNHNQEYHGRYPSIPEEDAEVTRL